MAARKTKRVARKAPRIGIFIYCSAEQRKRIKQAARQRGQTISGFMLSVCSVALDQAVGVSASND